jgi:hypothetical protein
MKFILIFALLTSVYAQDLKTRIEQLIIPPKKSKISYIKYDPFKKGQEVVQKTFKVKPTEESLHISTILNNRVFANSSWRSVGDEVSGYKIIQINKNEVLARKNGKIVKFGIKRQKSIVKVEDK